MNNKIDDLDNSKNNIDPDLVVEGQAIDLPELTQSSEFDELLDKPEIDSEIPETQDSFEVTEDINQPIEKTKKDKKKNNKKQKKQLIEELADNTYESNLSPEQEKIINKKNDNIDKMILKETLNNDASKETKKDNKHYVDAYDIDIEKISLSNIFKSQSVHKNTGLYLIPKIYNRFVEYLPSDFTASLIIDMFIDFKLTHLPKNSGFKLRLIPNDALRTIKVEVFINRFYSKGVIIEKRRAFSPIYITGFGEMCLFASTIRPIEKNYRIQNSNTFAYRETVKILNKKIAAKYINLSVQKYTNEQDFKQLQATKNSFIEHYVSRLNLINTIEWECIPDLYINWHKKRVTVKLFLKIESTLNKSKLPTILYIDIFNVNLNELLDFEKTKTKIVDIDTILYLIALNAMYKNIKIFSYNTLYECYKLISIQVLKRGYELKQISKHNLDNLKIVDFSKNYVCQKKMFDDHLLHIMNLMSSNEEYYRMKYMYTVQKNPNLLYSNFIVTEFEKVGVNELALLLRNEEEIVWRKRLESLKEINSTMNSKDKDFYINNYNILEYSKNEFNNIESYLMGVIKSEKDEITRISKLGEEILTIDSKSKFTKKELREIQKTARKLNRIIG